MVSGVEKAIVDFCCLTFGQGESSDIVVSIGAPLAVTQNLCDAPFGRREPLGMDSGNGAEVVDVPEERPPSEGTDADPSWSMVDIKAAQLMRLSMSRQRTFRFFRRGSLDFAGEPRAPPPYALGFWLGDGTANGPGYANAHETELQLYHLALARSYGLHLTYHGGFAYYLSTRPPKASHRMPKQRDPTARLEDVRPPTAGQEIAWQDAGWRRVSRHRVSWL